MRIFVPVWGSAHQQLFEKALAVSLSWPKNKAAIKGATWVVTSDGEQGINKAAEIIKQIDETAKIEGMIAPDLARPGVDSGMILIETLKASIKMCLSENTPMLMATPDFIYGDGTIDTFKTIAADKGICASIAHMRAVPHMLGNYLRIAPTNPELIKFAKYHAHTSWINSEVGKKPGMLHKGGVRWWKLSNELSAVQHFMPSPFYYNFLKEDLEHLSEWDDGRPPGFGCIDHTWTSSLIKSGRLRFIGSSDAACMVEITEPHMNVPPWNRPEDPDGEFFHKKFHNLIFPQFISIFRSESNEQSA